MGANGVYIPVYCVGFVVDCVGGCEYIWEARWLEMEGTVPKSANPEMEKIGVSFYPVVA